MPRAEMLSSFCAGGWGLGLSWTRKKLKVLRQHSEGTVRGAGCYLLNLVLITLQWLPIAYGIRLILCSLASEGLWSAPTSHHSRRSYVSTRFTRQHHSLFPPPRTGVVPPLDHGSCCPRSLKCPFLLFSE